MAARAFHRRACRARPCQCCFRQAKSRARQRASGNRPGTSAVGSAQRALPDDRQAQAIAGAADTGLVERVREVRRRRTPFSRRAPPPGRRRRRRSACCSCVPRTGSWPDRLELCKTRLSSTPSSGRTPRLSPPSWPCCRSKPSSPCLTTGSAPALALRLALRRYVPRRKTPLVQHANLREPRKGIAPPCACPFSIRTWSRMAALAE